MIFMISVPLLKELGKENIYPLLQGFMDFLPGFLYKLNLNPSEQ